MPSPSTATLGPPAARALAWAAQSIPGASPDTTTAPARASAAASSRATRSPYGLIRLVPTIATRCRSKLRSSPSIHSGSGAGRSARFAQSLKPLIAGVVVGGCVVAVPVTLTVLLAQSSNRPDISYAHAVQGSLHPASLMMLAFADVFGASDFNREFWGPPSIPWHDLIGQTGLYDSQNTGQIYTGALVAVSLLSGVGVALVALPLVAAWHR